MLTLAMFSGDTVRAGLLLAVYGAGMVLPLMVIAAAWDRLGQRGRARLRGRGFILLGRELHTTTVVTGLLIVVVGVLFWHTNGFLTMPSLLPTSAQTWVQGRLSMLAHPLLDLAAVIVGVSAVIMMWRVRRGRHHPGA